jgi:hypothetical protein
MWCIALELEHDPGKVETGFSLATNAKRSRAGIMLHQKQT